MPKISELFLHCPALLRPRGAFADAEISDLVTDSRAAKAGSAFVCLKGWIADGHAYAASAYENGCRCFLCEEPLALPPDALQIRLPDTRAALPYLASAFYGAPERNLLLVGITGTKGKTTVACLLYELLQKCGVPCGLIGTTGIRYATNSFQSNNTTPDGLRLAQIFSQMVRCGIKIVIMEVSSQAFLSHRVDALHFDMAIYTNLSADHIGQHEHPSFENYKHCKQMLFSMCDFAVLNRDDAYYADFAAKCRCPIQSYGFSADADFHITPQNDGGSAFTLTENDQSYRVPFSMPGSFNMQNAAAVLCAAKHLGIPPAQAAPLLGSCTVPGRFEQIEGLDGVRCIIDYAHNGASMESVLRCVRAQNPGRIVVLYGSVGSRTELRREELGTVCASLADFSILTADNPDFEDPEKICWEIASFYDRQDAYCIIPDRKEAIEYAVAHAKKGDWLLFLGKGHESYQIVRGKKEPFCERDIIRAAIAKRNTSSKTTQKQDTKTKGTVSI